MKKQGVIALLLLIWGAIMFSASADLLQLSNGDSLSGHLVRIQEGVLVFRTTLKGQIMAPVDTVQNLQTEDAWMLTMMQEDVFYGRLRMKDNETWLYPLSSSQSPHPLTLSQIQEALEIPDTSASHSEEEGPPQWKMAMESGVRNRTGSRGEADAYLRLGLQYQDTTLKARSEVLVERADPDDFPQTAHGDVLVQGNSDADTQPYVNLNLQRDTIAAIDARTQLSLGLTHSLASNDTFTLAGFSALSFSHEQWEADERSTVENKGQLQLGLRVSQVLFGKGELSENLFFYPSFTEIGAMRAASETRLRWPVSKALHLRLNIALEYDSEPALSHIDPWQSFFGAGIQVDF